MISQYFWKLLYFFLKGFIPPWIFCPVSIYVTTISHFCQRHFVSYFLLECPRVQVLRWSVPNEIFEPFGTRKVFDPKYQNLSFFMLRYDNYSLFKFIWPLTQMGPTFTPTCDTWLYCSKVCSVDERQGNDARERD